MAEPITLRGMLGLAPTPVPLSQSALILVDCQQTYREGLMQLEGVEPALDQCAALLARARRLGIPRFHIQHNGGDGTPYDVKAPIGAIADKVLPLGTEPVVLKEYPNSFLNTDLHQQLQQVAASHLVIVGFMTHMCISSTARAAFDLGYSVTVVGGATATRALPLSGGALPAAQVQSSNLAAIADLFAVVVEAGSQVPD